MPEINDHLLNVDLVHIQLVFLQLLELIGVLLPEILLEHEEVDVLQNDAFHWVEVTLQDDEHTRFLVAALVHFLRQ